MITTVYNSQVCPRSSTALDIVDIKWTYVWCTLAEPDDPVTIEPDTFMDGDAPADESTFREKHLSSFISVHEVEVDPDLKVFHHVEDSTSQQGSIKPFDSLGCRCYLLSVQVPMREFRNCIVSFAVINRTGTVACNGRPIYVS